MIHLIITFTLLLGTPAVIQGDEVDERGLLQTIKDGSCSFFKHAGCKTTSEPPEPPKEQILPENEKEPGVLEPVGTVYFKNEKEEKYKQEINDLQNKLDETVKEIIKLKLEIETLHENEETVKQVLSECQQHLNEREIEQNITTAEYYAEVRKLNDILVLKTNEINTCTYSENDLKTELKTCAQQKLQVEGDLRKTAVDLKQAKDARADCETLFETRLASLNKSLKDKENRLEECVLQSLSLKNELQICSDDNKSIKNNQKSQEEIQLNIMQLHSDLNACTEIKFCWEKQYADYMAEYVGNGYHGHKHKHHRHKRHGYHYRLRKHCRELQNCTAPPSF